MNCSNSSDPGAINATLLYNDADDQRNLWIRSNKSVPLSNCSSTAPPADSQCTVCVDQVVYAVCRNLIDGVKVIMEDGVRGIEILKSECPKLLSDECPKLLSDDAPQWWLLVVIILTLLLVFIAVMFAVKYRRCKRPTYSRGTEIQTDEENKPSDLSDVIVMNYTELN